ncbi:MAG TPA: histidine phosphatase family protein [Kiritimatiellia bacterium]|nr:histidine phosphatase family protein [Kiritimatiellia bacterium]
MRIYIVRHADPDYANDSITPAGHLEARALAERLHAEGINRIFCSPLGRARQTMQYTADRLNRAAEVHDWMQELSDMRIELPPWGNLAAWDIPAEVVHAGGAEQAYAGLDFSHKIQAINEDSDALLARLGYVRKDGRYHVVQPNEDRVAMFCHNGLGLTWLAHLLRMPLVSVWTSFWLAPTSVTTILFDQRSPEWAVPRCLAVGDTSHLHKAGLPILPRGIITNYV